MKVKKYLARQKLLEEQGQYDVDMQLSHHIDNAMPIKQNYNYLITKRSEKFRRAWLMLILKAVGPLITFFGQGARVVGRENVRALKGQGAVSICNHVHELDTLFLKNALGASRVYHTGAYYLMKRGWLGKVFKAGGFLPVGTSFRDIKNLQDAVGVLLKEGKIVNVYPEHALWPRYENLRPFKQGAFHFAAKFNAPVLPVFIEFRPTKLRKFFHMKKKVVIHILPAVFPPECDNLHEREAVFCKQVYAELCKYGKQVYGRSVEISLPDSTAEEPSSDGAQS